jgi:hypothetical protein
MGEEMGVGEILGLVFGGGATGLLGTLFGRVAGYYEKKQTFEHELALLDKQASMRMAEMENEAAIADSNAAMQIRTASYAHDTGTGKPSRWVVNTLRLVRPALTAYLIFLVTMIFFATKDGNIVEQVVATALYLATSSITWWFGDRSSGQSK